MQLKISGFSQIIISHLSRPIRPLLFLTAVLLCLSLLGCPKPCPVCPDLKITLPVEQAPLLRGIEATKRNEEYCLSDLNRRNVLIDIELLRSWGQQNQTIIEKFNGSR